MPVILDNDAGVWHHTSVSPFRGTMNQVREEVSDGDSKSNRGIARSGYDHQES